MFQKVTLIGLGMIGSSIGRAIKTYGGAQHVVGYDISVDYNQEALDLGVVDEIEDTPQKAVRGADLVIIATPVSTIANVTGQIAPFLKPECILTDTGSCKQSIVDAVVPLIPHGVHFIPGHPVAGTEKSGPSAGFAEVFQNRYHILTPLPNTDPQALDHLKSLFKGFGATVETMSPQHHDRVMAITSHLPHLIAYTIVGTASHLEEALAHEQQLLQRKKNASPSVDEGEETAQSQNTKTPQANNATINASSSQTIQTNEVIRYSASGFRDFTRIAGSDPIMWRDIFMQNKEPVLEMLGRFTEDLIALQKAIRWEEADTLEAWFTQTQKIRKSVIEKNQAGQFTPTENVTKNVTKNTTDNRSEDTSNKSAPSSHTS